MRRLDQGAPLQIRLRESTHDRDLEEETGVKIAAKVRRVARS